MGALDGEDSELRSDARGRIWYATLLECFCHGSGEAGALERVALLQLAAGGDDRLELGPEIALVGRESHRGGVEGCGDRLQWRGRTGCAGDPVREEPAQRVLAGDQHLSLVGEVPEEGALGQSGSLGDLDNGGVVVALLGEQVECGAHQALPCVRFPSGHAHSVDDATVISSLWYSDGTEVPSLRAASQRGDASTGEPLTRVFVTGASGRIGSAVVPELISAGHQVLGLARSDSSAAAIAATGAEMLRGDLDDLDTLRAGAASSDGVIHLAFIHDYTPFEASVQADARAIETMGAALEGSGKPLVIA